MKRKRAFVDALADPPVGEKVFNGKEHGALFAAPAAKREGLVGIFRFKLVENGLRKRHPARGVALVCNLLFVKEALNAAAVGVAHHDHVVDVEVLDGVFDGGEHGVGAPGFLFRRNERGDVSHDEEVARLAAHQDRRIGARVAARDDEGLGILAVGESVKELGFLKKGVRLEVVETLDEVVKVGGHVEGLDEFVAVRLWRRSLRFLVTKPTTGPTRGAR